MKEETQAKSSMAPYGTYKKVMPNPG